MGYARRKVWGGTRAGACGCRLGTVGKWKFGEGRAGAPGDQALLQMDGALLQSVAAESVGIPPLKYNEFIKWIVFDFCEMLFISSLPWK